MLNLRIKQEYTHCLQYMHTLCHQLLSYEYMHMRPKSKTNNTLHVSFCIPYHALLNMYIFKIGHKYLYTC